MEFDSLSPGQQETVTEFKAIASAENDDDTTKIIRLLEINDWNLNNAVVNFFDSGFDSVEHQSSGVEIHDDANELHHRRRGSDYVNLSNSFEMHDLIPRLPFAPRISNNWQIEVGIHSSLQDTRKNLAQTNDVVRKTLGSIWFVLLLIPKGLVTLLYGVLKFLFKVNFSSSNHFSHKFDYEKLDLDYKTADDERVGADALAKVNLVSGDFNGVHEQTKDNYNPLLVILLDDSPESYDFINTLSQDSGFAALFDKETGKYKETQVYINNVERHYESFEVAKTYKVRRLPYVMLVANVTNNPSIMASMSVVYKSNISSAFLDAANITKTTGKVLESLNKVLSTYNPSLVSSRFDKQEIEFSRMLKQKQDDAYLKSLEMDQVKKHEKLEKQKLETLAKLRDSFKLHLWYSKWFEQLNGEANCRISIKLPDGKRLIEKVDSSTKLRDLYLYIEVVLHCNEHLQTMAPDQFDEACAAVDHDISQFGFDTYYDHFHFTFELVQPYPKKVFDQYDQTLEEAGLRSGASLLVEHLEAEDDD